MTQTTSIAQILFTRSRSAPFPSAGSRSAPFPSAGSRSAPSRGSYPASINSDDALAILRADPAKTGIFVDFDGTLSRIVERPDDATALDGARDALEALAKRFALVAVVSGRGLEDLRRRIRARGVVLAGAYGRERSDHDRRRHTEGWETVSIAASAAVRNLDGVILERKGAGIALHYRTAPEHADAVAEIAGALAREFDLEIRPGRKVVELVVPGPGKGEAIAAMISEKKVDRVLVAGDDWGDLEAFAAVRSIGVTAVIVAIVSSEAPPDLASHADVVVDGPDAFVAMLAELATD